MMSNMEYSVAEAKKHFSKLLSRVAYGKEHITIAKRGKPLAVLVPPAAETGSDHLGKVEGWLENSDPFFKIVDQIVKSRKKHLPSHPFSFLFYPLTYLALIPSGQFPAACRAYRHSGESRSPEKNTGFRVKPGMTPKEAVDIPLLTAG
jgi:prevent-host-death family protein